MQVIQVLDGNPDSLKSVRKCRARSSEKHSMKRHTRKQVACDKMKWVDVVFTYIKKGTEQVWDEFGGGSSAIVEDMYIGESQGEGDKSKEYPMV
ncbi:hypothetical protein V6N13_002878 [Hibiscus sabdariffa]